MAEPHPTRRGTAAWILYDLANTIFSFNILSIYFPVWLHADLGLRDTVFAVGNSASMAIILLVAPALGALSDRARRRVPFLVASTVLCVAATVPLGFAAWQTSILFFIVANVGFQAGLIFYDALLAVVSTPHNRGRVGAIGVGVGYLGSLLGLGLGTLILSGHEERDAWVFVATGAAFLGFALPAFFLIPEPRREVVRMGWATILESARTSLQTLGRLLRGRDVPHMGRFLLARVFYTDAANTMIIFIGVYAVAEGGFTNVGVRIVLLLGIVGAAVASPLWGTLVDRTGPRNTLRVVLLLWMFSLLMVSLTPLLHLPKEVFYPIAFFLGAALGGTWSADRPLMLGLAPPHRLGEFYGLYSMVGRFAAIFGPLLWALIVDGLLRDDPRGRPAAVASLILFMVVAYALLRRLPDPTHPGPGPLAQFLPWRNPDGTARPLPRRWPLRFPFHAFYLVVTTFLFLAYRNAEGRVPMPVFEAFVYRIPRLFTDVPLTLLNFVTAVWVNHNDVQLVYVLVLLALFGVAFEVREGTKRSVLVFYVTSILAGLFAGLLLHALNAVVDAAWIDRAWDQAWAGGSAGAFGLMGGLAARARNPWLLLLVFATWEVNVGAWYLKSYTPAFHLTALVLGFMITRKLLPPRTGAAPAGAPLTA